MECNCNNRTFLTQIKWLYCEYRFYLKYNFITFTFYIYAFIRRLYPKRLTVHSGYTCFITMLLNCFKKVTFVIFKKKVVPQIHVCGVTTMDVAPLREEGILLGLLPVCKGHCRCCLIRGVHAFLFIFLKLAKLLIISRVVHTIHHIYPK